MFARRLAGLNFEERACCSLLIGDMEQFFLSNEKKITAILGALELQPGERVLELGAGAGTFAAAVPGDVRLALVELDPSLAARLRGRFPGATIYEKDALRLLVSLSFDVLLSNLPHALSEQVLARLAQTSFRVAAVAVREGQALGNLGAFSAITLLRLEPEDFSPRQPFASLVLLLRKGCA